MCSQCQYQRVRYHAAKNCFIALRASLDVALPSLRRRETQQDQRTNNAISISYAPIPKNSIGLPDCFARKGVAVGMCVKCDGRKAACVGEAEPAARQRSVRLRVNYVFSFLLSAPGMSRRATSGIFSPQIYIYIKEIRSKSAQFFIPNEFKSSALLSTREALNERNLGMEVSLARLNQTRRGC